MQIHLVAVKVGVVRTRGAQIHAKRVVRHDHHAMTHHRHLVQRGLSVEYDIIPVLEVTLHDVSLVHHDVLGESKILPNTVFSDDVLGPHVLQAFRTRPRIHILLDAFLVVSVYAFRKRHVSCDIHWDAQLVEHDVRLCRNDRPRGKINPFSHQIAAHASFLRPDALTYGFDGPSRALRRLRLTRDFVVDERVDVILQQRDGLLNCRIASFRIRPQQFGERLVAFQDVCHLVRDVVLCPIRRVHHH